jgi:hypothetical protein
MDKLRVAMKPNKNKKIVIISSSQPVELTPEQKKQREIRQQEWNRLTKFPEYSKKLGELSNPERDRRFDLAMRAFENFAEEDKWFAINYPYPSRVTHWSKTGMFAQKLCRRLMEIALYDNQNAIKTLASITVEMTETLTELLTKKSSAAKQNEELIKELNEKCAANIALEENAELLRDVASELPYWPMLRFLNAAANSEKQFQRIAEQLELGKECPINVSKSANYSLETPINSFVWKCLRHFQKVHSFIQRQKDMRCNFYITEKEFEEKLFEAEIARIVFEVVEPPISLRRIVRGLISESDIGIYKVSCTLPPLTKSTAKVWTDKAIIPYVCSNFPDFSKVPEFVGSLKRSGVNTRGEQRREIRRDILRSLTSMARK